MNTKALVRCAKARGGRTVERVRAAIEALQAAGEPVSLRRICAKACAQAPDAPRLCESVIARNPHALALYRSACPQLQDLSERRRRTVERVGAAIAALQAAREPVSLRRICAKASAQAPDAPRLCESVITRNAEADALYRAARPAKAALTTRRRHPRHATRSQAEWAERLEWCHRRIRELETALAMKLNWEPDQPAPGP